MQLFALNQLTCFRGKKFDIFPTGSYVKTYTMSADGGHLEYWISTKKQNFVQVHSRTIPMMFALNWLTGSRAEFPI